MKLLARGSVAAVVTVLGVMAPTAASAQVVADWGMNEGTQATRMIDDSGNGFTGDIGSLVVTGRVRAGSGYAYDFRGPRGGYRPEQLVTVPDDSRLDPGTEPYAVTLRFRTNASDPNIVQKGQSGQRGGYWKFVLKRGWPRCHFRDENHNTKAIGFVKGSPAYKVDDGQWHTVRCERLANGVRVTLNYGEPNAVSRFIRGSIGRIDNRRPLSIGGKLDCARADVGCDYFVGQIDWIRIDRP